MKKIRVRKTITGIFRGRTLLLLLWKRVKSDSELYFTNIVPPDLYANEGWSLPGTSPVVEAKVIWGHIMFYLETHKHRPAHTCMPARIHTHTHTQYVHPYSQAHIHMNSNSPSVNYISPTMSTSSPQPYTSATLSRADTWRYTSNQLSLIPLEKIKTCREIK